MNFYDILSLLLFVPLVALWILFAYLIGKWHDQRGGSFWFAASIAFLLGPCLGLVVCLLDPSRRIR